MRYLIVIFLAGCTQTMTLFPRAGGQPINGGLETASQVMTVTVEGETYTGSFIRAQSGSVGTFNTYGAKPQAGSVYVGPSSKQYSALLVSPSSKTLRCEFVGGLMETGNGVCIGGDGQTFDLLLTP